MSAADQVWQTGIPHDWNDAPRRPAPQRGPRSAARHTPTTWEPRPRWSASPPGPTAASPTQPLGTRPVAETPTLPRGDVAVERIGWRRLPVAACAAVTRELHGAIAVTDVAEGGNCGVAALHTERESTRSCPGALHGCCGGAGGRLGSAGLRGAGSAVMGRLRPRVAGPGSGREHRAGAGERLPCSGGVVADRVRALGYCYCYCYCCRGRGPSRRTSSSAHRLAWTNVLVRCGRSN